MVDFTRSIEKFNKFKGSEKKKTLVYNKKTYLVKFPDPILEKNKNVSFINNAFSEYVGSNIFKIIGFVTQNTIIGKYSYNGKDKIVCACEDFTDENHILYEFENLTLSANLDKKIDTELKDILGVIDNTKIMMSSDIREKFWDMFIVDSLIGNTDRHNGNWGFLVNKKNKKEVIFSPIFDCGSCLNPMLEDNEMEKLTDSELKNLAINCYSCIKENGKKINYMSFIKSGKNKDCNEAILRIFKNIDLEKINKFIDEINCMSEIRKNFYKEIIKIRYEIIKKVFLGLSN